MTGLGQSLQTDRQFSSSFLPFREGNSLRVWFINSIWIVALRSSSHGAGKRTRSHYLSSTCLQDAIKTNIHFQSFPSGPFLTSQRRTCGITSDCLLWRTSKCVEMLFTGLWPKSSFTWSYMITCLWILFGPSLIMLDLISGLHTCGLNWLN